MNKYLLIGMLCMGLSSHVDVSCSLKHKTKAQVKSYEKDSYCKKKCLKDIYGLYIGVINFAPETGFMPEPIAMNIGAEGFLSIATRLEYPLVIPSVPELGGDLEGAGLGQYNCRKDGSFDFAASLFRQGNFPNLFEWNIDSNPNYVMILGGNFCISKTGTLTGTMKIGVGDVSFALPNGVLTNSIPVESIVLQKQSVDGLFNAIP